MAMRTLKQINPKAIEFGSMICKTCYKPLFGHWQFAVDSFEDKRKETGKFYCYTDQTSYMNDYFRRI